MKNATVIVIPSFQDWRNTTPDPAQDYIVVDSGDGNRLAWRARAYTGTLFSGKTGACKSKERAIEAARKLLR